MKATIKIDGKTLYRKKGLPNHRTTAFTSAFECECDLCEFACDSKGNRVAEKEDNSPKVAYCQFEICPFKEFYNGQKGQWKKKVFSVDNELKRMLGKEKSNEED